MSAEHARQFILTVEQDAALQQQVDAFDSATASHEIVKLGAARDLHFSAGEFDAALESHLKSPGREIPEEELGSVSGGITVTITFPSGRSGDSDPSARGTVVTPVDPNRVIPPGTPHHSYWVKHGTV